MENIGIFIGTVYGNALLIAELVESVLIKQGHNVRIFEEGTIKEWQIYAHLVVLIITSTSGEGDLPDNIIPLFKQLKKLSFQPSLRYGVIALGDKRYNIFCGAGHMFDDLLQKQGATRIGNLLEVDANKYYKPNKLIYCWANTWGKLL